MSELGAINASNIAFQGSKETKEAKETKTAQTTDNKPKLTDRFTQPFRDEFKKAYGEDAEATPTLVADFVSDNVVKLGVFAAGGALLLAKSRKATNGLTEAIKDNINKFKSAATEGEKAGIFKKTVDTIKGTFGQVKANNLKQATESAKEAAESGSKTIRQTVEEAILRPKDFEEGTKLASFIDKYCGKHAPKVKETLGKIGIGNGSDLVDTAIAGTATVTLSNGVNDIAGDVTGKDNENLARQAKIERFENLINTASKLADTANMIAG